jgi:hypothetical protein
MAWSRLPTLDGLKAGKHWLANLEPAKETKKRKAFAEFKERIGVALSQDKELSASFREFEKIALWLGRVAGLREGLELYEYGERILEDNPRVFQSMMKYAITHPDNVSATEICDHLDKQISRIEAYYPTQEQKEKAAVNVRPAKDWGCKTWNEALKKERNNVDVFVHNAIEEACSTKYNKLCAWRTWGLDKSKKEARAADVED